MFRKTEEPACYAMVHPGLEDLAGEEIQKIVEGQVKKTSPGLVVFRVPHVDSSLLQLRTTEDVFLLAWGTDQLSYRAKDLDSIRFWTERKADWPRLLQIHHAIRPKPKGKPTYRLVVQMQGEHGYRRMDAGKALARGLAGKLPASWKSAEENAALEIWLTIQGPRAFCGVRLSDKTMRHRTYKKVHVAASLRPTLAAAMVRLADPQPGQVILDPMCGAGTLLAETLEYARAAKKRAGRPWNLTLLGGDADPAALRAAAVNLRSLGEVSLTDWDVRKLPLEDRSVDRILSNPPFGKQLAHDQNLDQLYRQLVQELNRVLRPGGKAVLLVMDPKAIQDEARFLNWKSQRKCTIRILGQRATILSYAK